MQDNSKILLASEEVRSNFRKTVILFCMMIICIFGLSWLLGELFNDVSLGLTIGLGICLIVIPLEMLSARFAIVSLTGCVPLDLSNPAEQRILSIVQGLSISAGLKKVPDVYLIETNVPNAFAAGWNEDTAFIGVTTGLADMMDDQELTGVMAHEISHIIHRDTMICQMSIALNMVMLLLAIFIRWVCFSIIASDNDDDSGNAVIFKCVLWLLFFFIYPLSAVVGFILCMAISRKREFAADAMAVRLCSYNEGLARALEKLKEECPVLEEDDIQELGGKEVESLYFYYPVDSIFSTHPDTSERIHRLRSMF